MCLVISKHHAGRNSHPQALRPAAEYARGDLCPRLRQGAGEGRPPIPAQLKLLKDYDATEGFTVAQEYVDVETAKQTGSGACGEMVDWLRAHPDVRVILVEKTDRLYRNLKDWVTIDELHAEIRFPREGVVLSRDSRSSEKFMHGIRMLMAKNDIDNLSEEARKGMQEKAETPLGHLNATGPDGRKMRASIYLANPG